MNSINALSLLEMVLDGTYQAVGTLQEFVAAAHSLVKNDCLGAPSLVNGEVESLVDRINDWEIKETRLAAGLQREEKP